MIQKLTILLISLSFGLVGMSQYKKEYIKFDSIEFTMPLDIPLILAGNFGELRANHFHTGLDFKTQRVTGKKIRAIEQGYVSRIKISHWGYGKVIYIDHPNGLTSVYAHCSRFPEKIDSIIRKAQFDQKNDQIEIFPKKGEISLIQGEHIAYSGNTGSSSAPHLHFEIRETKTEHALNPLLFKAFKDKIKDHKKPNLMGFKVYALSKEGYRIPNKSKYFTIKNKKGKIVVNNNKPIIIPANYSSSTGGIGIAIHSDDLLDAAGNHCGIYKTQLYVNGKLRHEQEISHVDFATNRYINTHMDYERYKAKRVSLHKQFCSDINLLPIYPTNNGLIKMKPGDSVTVKMLINDVHGNKTVQSVRFSMAEGNVSKDFYTKKYHDPKMVLFQETKTCSVQLGKNTIYEPLKLQLKQISDTNNKHSDIFTFGSAETPVHQYFVMSITPKSTADTNHLVLLRKNEKNHWISAGGTYDKGVFRAKLRHFGSFKLSTDSTPPTITEVNFKNNSTLSSKVTSLKFKLSDNLSGLDSYHLYIDGKWQLLTRYRRKRIYAFEGVKNLSKGVHDIKLIATDAIGNVQTKTWKITK